METISCHSNQSSYPTGIKNITFVKGNVICKYANLSFSLIPLTVSKKKNFEYFFEKLPFMSPRQPIKLSDLDKSRMKHGGLPNKHICEKNSNISNETAETVNFNFSHYKFMETISSHSNQSSYPTGIKPQLICPKHVCQFSASSPLWLLRIRFLNIFTKTYPFCHPDNQSNSLIWTKVA